MPVHWSEADEVWKKLVQGLLDGKFSDELGIYFIQIKGRHNPRNLSSLQRHNMKSTMITIYTRDWTDQKAIWKIAEIARDLGLKNELSYKTDAYTNLGIYRRNVYDLQISIYWLPKVNILSNGNPKL